MQEDERNVRLCIIPNESTRFIDLALDESDQFIGGLGFDIANSKEEMQNLNSNSSEEQVNEKKDFSIIMLSQTVLPINMRKLRLYQASVAV